MPTLDSIVVLGAGMAGLSAAAAVAPHAGSVTVVERDRLPEHPSPRGGVPQSRHVHTLLVRGRRELDALIPGLDEALVDAGAVRLDVTSQPFRLVSGWSPRYRSGLVLTCCTRELLEHTVRSAVGALPNVRILEGARATGLIGDRARVRGVRLVGRGSATHQPIGGDRPDRPPSLDADLVIDASGRSSDVPQWLVELGFSRVPEEVIDSHLGYASRVLRLPAGWAGDWLLLLTRQPLPSSRGGLLYPVEGGRWFLTLAGVADDVPPHDEEGFAEFAASLGGAFAEAVAASEPLSRIATYRTTANRRRQWRRIGGWPEGLLVMGDANCAFNPVYGQGMSVAAAQASLIRSALAEGNLAGTGAWSTQRRIGRVLSDPWGLATQEDFRFPTTEGHRSPAMRASHWYADQVITAAARDQVVYRRFVEVAQLLRPRRDLLDPRIVRRLVGPGRRAAGNPEPAARTTPPHATGNSDITPLTRSRP